MMANDYAYYKVYVIRCWKEQSSTDLAIHRFTLEVPGMGQRLGFTSSQALIHEIERRLAEPAIEQPDATFGDPISESCFWQPPGCEEF